jgi:hypothetical protein
MSGFFTPHIPPNSQILMVTPWLIPQTPSKYFHGGLEEKIHDTPQDKNSWKKPCRDEPFKSA